MLYRVERQGDKRKTHGKGIRSKGSYPNYRFGACTFLQDLTNTPKHLSECRHYSVLG